MPEDELRSHKSYKLIIADQSLLGGALAVRGARIRRQAETTGSPLCVEASESERRRPSCVGLDHSFSTRRSFFTLKTPGTPFA